MSESASLDALLRDRLVMVTGKGGTGKTTVAASLALLLAARGKRTLLCEVDNQRPSLTPIFGVEPGYQPVRVHDRLDVCNLVWPESLAAYLTRMIPLGRIVRSILQNDMIRRFLDFVPGSQELVTVSAIVDLIDKYDVVVVDLPASGHAFSMLDITRSALGLFRGGPLRARVLELRQALKAPTTRLVLVALPEEMVVNETLETAERMKRAELVGAEPIVLLNRAIPPSLTDEERTLLAALEALPLKDAAAELVAAGRWERGLEEAAGDAIDRLGAAVGRPPFAVPPVPAQGSPRAAVRLVAVQLGRALGVGKQELTWT